MVRLHVPPSGIVELDIGEAAEDSGDDDIELGISEIDANAGAGTTAEGEHITLEIVALCRGAEPAVGIEGLWGGEDGRIHLDVVVGHADGVLRELSQRGLLGL